MLIFELAFVFMLSQMLNHAGQQLEREEKVREIISHLNNLTHLFNQTTVGLTRVMQHGWISGETAEQSEANPQFQKEYYKQPRMVRQECLVLRKLVQGDPVATEALNDIDRYCQNGLMMMEKVRMCAFGQNSGEQYSWLAKLHKLGEATVEREDRLLRYYTDMESEISAQEAKGRQTASTLIVVLAGFNIAIAFLFLFIFTRGITGRLKRVSDNSLRLAVRQELHPVMKGSDEIAKLDQQFHEVAEALEEANQKREAIVANATDLIC